MKDNDTGPQRWVGPFSAREAAAIMDRINSVSFKAHDPYAEALLRFMRGEIDPREFVYDLQSLIETTADALAEERMTTLRES